MNILIVTTEEITQALECCKSESLLDCERCPLYVKKVGFEKCRTELLDLTFDLVRRQNKTIELLKNRIIELQKESKNGTNNGSY